LRVLVVDDHVATTESIELLFSTQGHETRTAHDGAGAIQLAHAFCPHLILLDIAMPGMDGYQVASTLRTVEGSQHSAIIAVTGYAHPLDRRRCAEADFDLHLSKPVDPDVLEQLPLLLRDSGGPTEKSRQLARKQTQSLLSLVGSGIQMANAFLDVAAHTKDPALRARCISKVEKSHQTLIKLIQRTAPERMDLIAALDELRWRYKWLRL
jgi:CheY-like chemotaxis protein